MPFPFLEKIHEETLSLSKRRVTETRAIEVEGRRTRAFNLQTCRQGSFFTWRWGTFLTSVALCHCRNPDAARC